MSGDPAPPISPPPPPKAKPDDEGFAMYFPPGSDVSTDVILVFGPRRYGKTTLASIIVPMCAPREKTMVIDPTQSGTLRRKLPGYPWRRVTRANKEAIDALYQTLYQGPPVFVAQDEVDEVCTPQGFISHNVRQFMHHGRNEGHGILAIARDPSNIHKDWLRNADTIFVGALTEVNTQEYLEDLLVDQSPDGGEVKYARVLAQMPDHVFLVWRPRDRPTKFGGFVIVEDSEIVFSDWVPVTATRDARRE